MSDIDLTDIDAMLSGDQTPDHSDASYRVAARELRQFIERAERIAEDIKAMQDESKDLFAEAKSRGYDVKVLKRVIALRKRSPDEIAEEEAVLDMYRAALGV